MSGFALLPDHAMAQSADRELPQPNPEDLKHGAVLCSWMILLGTKKIGEKCYPGQDTEFQALLAQSIARVDQFIIDNAPMTREKLEELKQASPFGGEIPTESLCSGDYRKFYEIEKEAYGKLGPEALRRGIDDLLSVPRQPVMNPCL
jgi:hypothetical protein